VVLYMDVGFDAHELGVGRGLLPCLLPFSHPLDLTSDHLGQCALFLTFLG
jgi:hypothetical protein